MNKCPVWINKGFLWKSLDLWLKNNVLPVVWLVYMSNCHCIKSRQKASVISVYWNHSVAVMDSLTVTAAWQDDSLNMNILGRSCSPRTGLSSSSRSYNIALILCRKMSCMVNTGYLCLMICSSWRINQEAPIKCLSASDPGTSPSGATLTGTSWCHPLQLMSRLAFPLPNLALVLFTYTDSIEVVLLQLLCHSF